MKRVLKMFSRDKNLVIIGSIRGFILDIDHKKHVK